MKHPFRCHMVLLVVLAITLGPGSLSYAGQGDFLAKFNRHHSPARYCGDKTICDPIQTDNGYVAGTMIGDADNPVRIYRSIPYAAPPVDDLRWRPPQPAEPWAGIRECTRYGLWAPQSFPTAPWSGSVSESQMGEDCLYLNILTPAKRQNDRLPVMVWLHGGGLWASSGNMPSYNYPHLPQHGVVVVTVSHRLGPIGYMSHSLLAEESEEGASGNYGQLDQIAALKWVQNNISAFGGDPDNVTIFGQSGGGQKVVWLMTSPLASGLFHRAIIEAGIGYGTGGGAAANYVFTNDEAEANGETLAAALGVDTSAPDALDTLRAISWQAIITAASDAAVGFSTRFTVDGWSLIDTPHNTFAAGMQNDVPFMIGAGEPELAKHQGTAEWAPALLSGQSDMYVYIFSQVPANWEAFGLQAYHGLEVAYQFGTIDLIQSHYNALFAAPEGLPRDPGIDEEDRYITEATMDLWTRFARKGDPSVRGLIAWPDFRLEEGQDRYLDIRYPMEVKSGFMETYRPE